MAKVNTVVGYKADADVYCIPCTIDRYGEPEQEGLATVDREGNEVFPLYLGSEFDHAISCGGCGEELNVTVIGRGD